MGTIKKTLVTLAATGVLLGGGLATPAAASTTEAHLPKEPTASETTSEDVSASAVRFVARPFNTPSRYNPSNTTSRRGQVDAGISYTVQCWIRGQSVEYAGTTTDKWLRMASGNYVIASAFSGSFDRAAPCDDPGGVIRGRIGPTRTTASRAHPSNLATQVGVVSPGSTYGVVCHIRGQHLEYNGTAGNEWNRLQNGHYVTAGASGIFYGPNCRELDG